jgi:hypothetical protein
MFDLRLWRLDILQLTECCDQALADLADADLFSMSFNRESASVFSMELTCLVEKCFGRGGKSNSVLLASTDGACVLTVMNLKKRIQKILVALLEETWLPIALRGHIAKQVADLGEILNCQNLSNSSTH